MKHEVLVGNVYRERDNRNAIPRDVRVLEIRERLRWNRPTLMARCAGFVSGPGQSTRARWIAVERLGNERGWRLVTETSAPTAPQKSPGQACFEAYEHEAHGPAALSWVHAPRSIRAAWERAALAGYAQVVANGKVGA